MIKLKHKITINGESISELNMRRPKVRDMLIADKSGGSDGEKEVAMFANLCEVESAVIEEFDMLDYQTLQKVYSDFLS